MKVSIVTPSFNQGRFLERTIRSVADQAVPGIDLEHVVFDGGSTDETLEILRRYGNRVQWVSEPDKGQAHAVNKGILATEGDIIGWLNSDDIYYPEAILNIVRYFLNHPEIGVVYGQADHIDVDDNPIEAYPTEPWDFARLQETCFICQPALFIRRELMEGYGLLDEKLHYCMDYEYWLRLGKAGVKFGHLEKKIAGSRLYASNKTLGARVKVHKEINDMFRKTLASVPDRWLMNYAHAVVGHHYGAINHPSKKHIIALGLTSVYAALRWNKSISNGMKETIMSWLKETLINFNLKDCM